MATIDEFLDELGISGDYTTSDGEYTILLSDSDEFQDVYSILSTSEAVDLDVDNILVTEDENRLKYIAEDYDLTLECNFNGDIYKLIIEDAKEE